MGQQISNLGPIVGFDYLEYEDNPFLILIMLIKN